ncbi:MAG: hypothetical protein WAN87_10435 [Thermoplasmata archaeon]
MNTDSEADRIRRDREGRRAEERARIEERRRERRTSVERLRAFDVRQPDPLEQSDHSGNSPKFLIIPARNTIDLPDGSLSTLPALDSDSETDRMIGRAIQSRRLRDFLSMDPIEKFDIQALNAFHFLELVAEANGDPAVLERLAHRAQILLSRVKQEVDDPLSAGGFLREQVLDWYRHSYGAMDWAERTPERWAGIFADSRVNGGNLHPWLNLRLWSLRNEALRSGRWSGRLRHTLGRDRVIESSIARTGVQRIQAETSQAILDDLATHPRPVAANLPLVRLSELAVRREVQTVNEALATLFGSPVIGPFVVLHPNRYPDCEELLIRPPIPGATGAALAYALVTGHSTARGAGSASHRNVSSNPRGGRGEAEDSDESFEEDLDGTSIWESDTVGTEEWARLLGTRRREKRRLEPPPKDYRLRPAYPVLRKALLEDVDFRKSFLAVKWRGRPAGLPLLTVLLQKGVLAPEVVTDFEYLEAELGELVQGDPNWVPPDNRWMLPGWVVTREGERSSGYRYRAESSGASSVDP